MKSFQFLLLALFGGLFFPTLSAQEGPDKIGTVDMRQLLSEYYKTEQLVEQFKGYEKIILDQNEERAEAIKALATERKELQAQAENAALPREKQEELFAKMMARQREIQALEQDRMTWLNRKRSAFTEKQKIDFGALRKELMTMVQEVGKERGFDFIFDSSAASIANVQVLAYAKDSTDLTAVMIERVNRDAPEKTGSGEGGDEEPTE
jgi:outer membrane protein